MALLWLSEDEVDSLCEHVIACQSKKSKSTVRNESPGMGWRLGDIISSLRVRLKRETLRQVAEEEQNTGVPSTVLSVMCSVWYAR